MRHVLDIADALSDASRLRALMFLRHGELCMCQIVRMLGLAPSTVSRHMSLLHRAGLVESRKEGRWVYYRLADARRAPAAVRRALQWVRAALQDDPVVAEDDRRLRTVLQCDRADLSACYRA